MILALYRYGAGRNEPHEVSDDLIRAFVEWLCNTSQWKQAPDYLMRRALKLRGDVLAKATYVKPVLRPDLDTADYNELRTLASKEGIKFDRSPSRAELVAALAR